MYTEFIILVDTMEVVLQLVIIVYVNKNEKVTYLAGLLKTITFTS